uniref:Ice-binding protein C-terminal domain-containing protein n=1 Tax=uncultured bacterium RM57 TaxID=561246 RepID=C8XT81_9BACT|nr:hypothetical protein [uncultured bacterium RM57]
MNFKFRSFALLIAPLALTLGSNSVSASTITFVTPSGSMATGGDGPVSASAAFTTSAGQVMITLTNTLALSSFRDVGETISDLSFTLSNAPGTVTAATASGQQGNISSTGLVTYTTGSPDRFIGVGSGISGNTITLEAIGGGKPTELIAPFLANGSIYPDTNPGIDAHNPYTIGPATFTISLTGVTSSTTINAATFSFGTGPDTFVPGTPVTTPPPPTVPEPSSLLLALTGLAALGAAQVIRFRSTSSGGATQVI